MLRKIKLYGKLAEFIGHKEFEIQADTISKAVSFLIHNFPEVEAYMSPRYYQVKIGNYSIDKDEINYPIGKQDIHFIPVITGAGRGLGKVLLGAALIGVAIASGGAGFGAGGAFGFGSTTGAFSLAAVGGNIGIALVLSGVSDMLFPMPQQQSFSTEEDPRLSFSFSGVQNTSRAGTPVPIVYGEIFIGSVVISAAIDTNQIEA